MANESSLEVVREIHIEAQPETVYAFFVDPDKMIVARNAGALPYELHRRAWTGDFAPSTPYDPRVLL